MRQTAGMVTDCRMQDGMTRDYRAGFVDRRYANRCNDMMDSTIAANRAYVSEMQYQREERERYQQMIMRERREKERREFYASPVGRALLLREREAKDSVLFEMRTVFNPFTMSKLMLAPFKIAFSICKLLFLQASMP